MKLKYEMEIIEIDGSPMGVPVDGKNEFHGVLHMNGTTQSIIEVLEKDVTEDEIVSALLKEYDATEEQVRNSVQKIIGILKENGLLCE